jgi:hypothetical protein
MNHTAIDTIFVLAPNQPQKLFLGLFRMGFIQDIVLSIFGFVAATYIRGKHEEKIKAHKAEELTQYFQQALSSIKLAVEGQIKATMQFTSEILDEKIRVPLMLFQRSLGFENYDAIPIMDTYDALVTHRVGSKERKTSVFADIHSAVGSIKSSWAVMQTQHEDYVNQMELTEDRLNELLRKIQTLNNSIETKAKDSGNQSLSIMESNFRVIFSSLIREKSQREPRTSFFWDEEFFQAIEAKSKEHHHTEILEIAQSYLLELRGYRSLRKTISERFEAHAKSLNKCVQTTQDAFDTLIRMPFLSPSYVVPNWLIIRIKNKENYES